MGRRPYKTPVRKKSQHQVRVRFTDQNRKLTIMRMIRSKTAATVLLDEARENKIRKRKGERLEETPKSATMKSKNVDQGPLPTTKPVTKGTSKKRKREISKSIPKRILRRRGKKSLEKDADNSKAHK